MTRRHEAGADDAADDPHCSLWAFSLAFYARPDVPPLLLRLQDECGADVNMLLFGLWRAFARKALALNDVRAIDARVAAWRSEVVVPARALRRRIRARQQDAAAAAALYDSAKRLELEAERIQQSLMQAAASAAPGSAAPSPGQAAVQNLETCARVMGVDFPKPVVEALAANLAAMADEVA